MPLCSPVTRTLTTLKPMLALTMLLASVNVLGHDYQVGELHIAHPSSMATPPGAPNGVAYLSVHHRGDQTDRLLSASTPRASRVQLHQSVEKDGMSTMRQIPLPLAIEPGGELKLEQGGYHFMLMDLTEPLKAGERIPLTLSFEDAGPVEVELMVDELTGHGGGHHSH